MSISEMDLTILVHEVRVIVLYLLCVGLTLLVLMGVRSRR